MLNESLKRVCVIGAAGKMGSGIALLLLQEIARIEAELTGNVGGGEYCLHLIDMNDLGLAALKKNLTVQLRSYAERNINSFREYFARNPALISNTEIIDAVVLGGMDLVRVSTEILDGKNASLVFEAIVEDIPMKTELFSKMNGEGWKDAYYFTNTSSIPIQYLCEQSGLGNRLIGYHFYNPPAIQKLLEIIVPKQIDPTLQTLGDELAKRLGKIVVHSEDIAGFIGNGHFIREIVYTSMKVKALEKEYGREMAIAMMDRLTRDFLVRPMGIFQLMDYVGIDVCRNVISVMSRFLYVDFYTEIIDDMLNKERKGGQNPDGTQKDGFFHYEQRMPVSIFEAQSQTYVPIPKDPLGDLPPAHPTWKHLADLSHKEKDYVLEKYFLNLFVTPILGSTLAIEYLENSRKIAQDLVNDGIAKSMKDVNTVLINGFYHLYGADQIKLPEEVVVKQGEGNEKV